MLADLGRRVNTLVGGDGMRELYEEQGFLLEIQLPTRVRYGGLEVAGPLKAGPCLPGLEGQVDPSLRSPSVPLALRPVGLDGVEILVFARAGDRVSPARVLQTWLTVMIRSKQIDLRAFLPALDERRLDELLVAIDEQRARGAGNPG